MSMDITVGTIVKSIAGRDAGQLFFVLKQEQDFLWLADGKRRKLENPKRKRCKHTVMCKGMESPASQKIANGEKITNNELRKAIAVLIGENPNREER